MANKEIKVTASADTAAFAKSIQFVRELRQEVSKLADATAKAQAGLGGGARVTGVASTPGVAGSPASSQQGTQRAGAGAGSGLTDTLTKSVMNSAALFKNAAEGSKGAFKVMSGALHDHVSKSDQEITRLVSSLKKLETTYDRLKSRQAAGLGGKLTEGAIGKLQQEYYEDAKQLGATRDNRGKMISAGQQIGLNSGPFAQARPNPLTQPLFPGVSKAIQGPLSAMGINLPPGSGIVAGVMAGLALASKGVGAYHDNATTNIGYQLDAPMFAGQRRAAFGSFYGGTALAVRHGDIARSMALGRLAQDKDYRQVISSEYRGLLRAEMEKKDPSFLEMPTIGNAKRLVGQEIGSTIAEMKKSIFGSTVDIGTDTPQAIAQARMRQEAATRVTQATQKMLENEMQRDPMFNDRVNTIYGGATGSLSMARAAGISGGLSMRRNGMGVMEPVDSLQMLRARALNSGYDPGEWVGMIQTMQGAAGRRSMSAATGSMLSMTHGGLANAPALFGAGQEFGGGTAAGGSAFMRAIQGKTGTGGIDPVAASSLFGVGAGLMQSGSFADSSGIGMVGVLGDAGYTGTPGGDIRRARELAGGVSAYGSVLSGSVDPLQMALNSSAAIRAAPHGSYAVHKGLMGLDPGTMMEVMRTGKVPAYLAARGITADTVRKYSGIQNSTAFSRYSSSMGGDSPMGAAAGRYTKAGGLSYLRGSTRGQVESEVDRLAEVLVDTTGASRSSARSRLLLQASMDGLLPSVRGKGARQSASMSSTYGVSSQIQGFNEDVEAVKRGAQNDAIKSGVVASPDTVAEAEAMRQRSQAAAGTGGDTDVAIDKIDLALRGFVASLRRAQGSFSAPAALRQGGPLPTSAHR